MDLQVVCAAILHEREDKILLAKRHNNNPWNGDKWEMPGGKIGLFENLNQALVREIRKELGVGLIIRHRLCTVFHRKIPADIDCGFTHFDLHAYVCTIGDEKPQALASQEVKWWELQQIDNKTAMRKHELFVDGFFPLYSALELYLEEFRSPPPCPKCSGVILIDTNKGSRFRLKPWQCMHCDWVEADKKSY